MKILFSWGNPYLKTTWSNVPFCFSNALRKNGHEVIGYNLNSHIKISRFWDKYVTRYMKKLFRNCQYEFLRTISARFLANRIIKSAVKRHPDADVCIFTTFSFYNKRKNIPSILFCDWTYESWLERIGHTPFFFEKHFINKERECLKNADICVSLFPEAAHKINEQLEYHKVIWGGVSAVNIVDSSEFDNNNILKQSVHSNKILFIGDGKYLEGAKLLLQAFKLLKRRNTQLELHIIGLQANQLIDIKEKTDGIYFYGYLSKDKPSDCEIYYEQLRSAAVFCNPTEIWGGFSSTIEAMFYYTPIVVSPYVDFVAQFGEKINFGKYNLSFKAEALAYNIECILKASTKQRTDMCKASHHAVANCNWETYSAKILQLLNCTKFHLNS